MVTEIESKIIDTATTRLHCGSVSRAARSGTTNPASHGRHQSDPNKSVKAEAPAISGGPRLVTHESKPIPNPIRRIVVVERAIAASARKADDRASDDSPAATERTGTRVFSVVVVIKIPSDHLRKLVASDEGSVAWNPDFAAAGGNRS